jgi:cytochrome c peroxidase
MKGVVRAGLLLAAVLIAAVGGLALWSPLPLAEWMREPRASLLLSPGVNPDPVRLLRPGAAPLSAMAMLGSHIFYDPGLSSSGRLACASCHDARHAYGPGGALPAMLGGPSLMQQGMRAAPSLMYLERQPNFSIGPDNAENENVNIAALTAQGGGTGHAAKSAERASAAANQVPQGGLFWDGRADTLQNQAMGPLTSPFEMDGGSVAVIAAKLARAPYAAGFVQLFGPGIFADPQQAVAEALFAVARYQIEDPGFHPYSSKYDAWLEGRARLSAAELRGYLAFNDPAKGNCAACHLDRPGADGLPPLFTDHQFEALGVPRNPALAANRDPGHFDLGLCGRDDMKAMPQYCGLFGTPTLRNAAMRRVFFHNGVYHTLRQVLDFYNFRGPQPENIYPRTATGALDMFNDLPPRYRANVDSIDAPMAGEPGDPPAMTARDESDIIAFLGTLTDGYRADGYRPAP